MCGTTRKEPGGSQRIFSSENDLISNESKHEDCDEMEDCASNFNVINSSSSFKKALENSYTMKNNLKNLPNSFEISSSQTNLAATNNNNKSYSINNSVKCQQSTNEMEANQERRFRQMKRQADWSWLNACIGVVDNDWAQVEQYLSRGGNVARSITQNEALLLNRPSAFDIGHTLIHLAIRFHRDELLPRLLAQISSNGPSGIKCVPECICAPELATDIRRHFGQILRIRKMPFNCNYVNEHATFSLPSEIEELPLPIQDNLYERKYEIMSSRDSPIKQSSFLELLDRDAQKQLENPPVLNWSLEITSRLGSRLMVLWNRSAGDCLLDSCMQATWGVFDRDNILRRALSDSLHQCANFFYPRWKEYEMIQAALLHFTLEEAQWEEDWGTLLTLASQPGASLEQLHIFVLAHIFRRPIIVYGVKNVKSFRGEDIGFARFEGELSDEN